MEFELFAGRFHPIFVHLPIGMIILGFLLELIGFIRKNDSLDKPIKLSYLIGFFAAVFAVISGLLLSQSNAYPTEALSLHKWLGISTMLGALVLYFLKRKPEISPPISILSTLALTTLVGVTGHFGGNLTHGEDYLFEYAPAFVQRLVNVDQGSNLSDLHPDSIVIYNDIIKPILDQKCVSCHAGKEAFGGFDATRYDYLFEEAETGTPVTGQSIANSEIFRRISLPVSDRKFMPPSGDPLNYTEIMILKYWIEQGADSAMRFDYQEINEELAVLLNRDYGLDYTPKPYYERVTIDSIDVTILQELFARGFVANHLAESNNFLDVRFTGDSLTAEDMETLSRAGSHIVFADLHGKKLTDEGLSGLAAFTNLVRLDIHDNPITDEGAAFISNLEHLETLNIYGTQITDSGLEKLLELPSLNRIYVWETQVTEEFVEQSVSKYPHIRIERGFSFAPIDSTAVATSK
ncbi:DUF2231 domain-containing protein [Fulvivirga sedimenti]|uniref:Cytochrome C Planctomycete-type domain-containing protein n=1 Tax=Fulvivirga sedimenti TaxID=2879465 RepID=A0A9X1HMW4_9BACT|nr:DUF2231 domain-containing protein [Fulvivirga sedimenti]MCA6073748.1 hypothetical protein [Fulvivirga sedimenti]